MAAAARHAPWPRATPRSPSPAAPRSALTYDFTSQGTEVYGIYDGQRWGYAHAHATFATQRTGPDIIVACARGTAAQVPMDLTLTTATTLLSTSMGGIPGASHRHAQRLRLVVRPRRVTVGRRVSFYFRVTNGAGAPIGGVTIRLGSHTARSSAHGTARITTTLHHPGTLTARATTPGWPAVAVTVVVAPAAPARRVGLPVFTASRGLPATAR
jgi:hypothetical protein